MQFRQAAQHIGRLEAKEPGIRGAVHRLIDIDFNRAVQQTLDRDPRFQPRERRTGTGMAPPG